MATGPLLDELENPPSHWNPDSLYEVINGERVEVAGMAAYAGSLASILAGMINQIAMPKKLGIAVMEVLFDFGPGRSHRRPDVAYMKWDRWQSQPNPQQDPPAWKMAPNLAIEMISPSNTAEEIQLKIIDYFEAGVELVWVFYPRQECCQVNESLNASVILHRGDELSAGSILPAFRIKLTDLFDFLV